MSANVYLNVLKWYFYNAKLEISRDFKFPPSFVCTPITFCKIKTDGSQPYSEADSRVHSKHDLKAGQGRWVEGAIKDPGATMDPTMCPLGGLPPRGVVHFSLCSAIHYSI